MDVMLISCIILLATLVYLLRAEMLRNSYAVKILALLAVVFPMVLLINGMEYIHYELQSLALCSIIVMIGPVVKIKCNYGWVDKAINCILIIALLDATVSIVSILCKIR